MKASKQLMVNTLIALVLGSFSSVSFATIIDYGSCNNADVKLTHYVQYNNPASEFNGSINSTDCAGSFNHWPDIGGLFGQNNLGFDGDGFMNGGGLWGSPSHVVFPTGAFVTDADKLDLNGDNIKDPGWVYLGADFWPWTGHSFLGADVGVNLPAPAFDVPNDLFHFHFGAHTLTSGSWFLTPDEDIPEQIEPWFGEEKFFDQFAMVFYGKEKVMTGERKRCKWKRVNGKRKKVCTMVPIYEWKKRMSIYDFTTEGMGLDPSTIGPGLDPYVFNGTFDVSGAMDKVVGIQLWARDPIETPEPGAISLIAFIILGYVIKIRRRLIK